MLSLQAFAQVDDEAYNVDENYKIDIDSALATVFASMPNDDERIECLIESNTVIDLASPADGIVRQVYVDRGDEVKKGQIIARLKSNIEASNMKISEVKLEYSQRNYQRIVEMNNKKHASDQEKDEAEIQALIAQYELEHDKQLLLDRTVRSPINGVVVERLKDSGEFVDESDNVLIKLVQINPLNVEVLAPLSLIGKVKVGMSALVYPEKPLEGPYDATVSIIDKVIDAASGTLGVRLAIDNNNHDIPAGIKCTVAFILP